MTENIGEKIKQARLEKNLSYHDLAELSGVTPVTIYNIEKNNFKKRPRPIVLYRILKALNIEND